MWMSRATGGRRSGRGTWRSLVSALVWGTRGRRFKSGRPDRDPRFERDGHESVERGRRRRVETERSTATRPPASRIWTIPNVISFVRLATVPVFVVLFVTDQENAAVILYALGAWSDFADGYIARRTNSVTELGKLLDPLADRIFIAALVIALVVRGTLPWWVAVVILGRDLLVLSLFPYMERRKIERIAVNRVGKTATAALLAGLTFLALSETTFVSGDVTEPVGMVLTLVGAALYWAAAYLYAREALSKLRALDGPAG